jgi:glycosyltransferase involved in cell wall biosynthesis
MAGLPDAFVLYQGPEAPEDLYSLLEAWSWAAGSIGEGTPLVILREGTDAGLNLDEKLVDPELMKTVRVLSRPTSENPASWTAGIYKQAAAFFSAAEMLPWGDPMRNAMRCGLPVAAAETKWTGAAVGPAAYLAPKGDARALGAALLTLIVEEEAAEKMGEAAAARAEKWQPKIFGERLLEIYGEAG